MNAMMKILTLVAVLMVLVGWMPGERAGAEGRFRPRPYNESLRLKEKDTCRNGGGTSFETDYHYGFGGDTPTSVTTICHGGTQDGRTCEINGSSTITCATQPAPTDDDRTVTSGGARVGSFDATAAHAGVEDEEQP